MTLTEAIALYREYLEHEQHASETTRLGYGSGLRRFQRFLVERSGEEPLAENVTADDCRSYLYSLSRRGLRPRTLRGAMYPLRGLFALLVERGCRSDNPARAVKLPKKDAVVRAAVSDEELEQLLAGCGREPDQVRRAMLRGVLSVLAYAGLRRQELLDLQLDDLDFSEGKLRVRCGKGGKSRSLYLCRPCLQALREWLAVRPASRHPYLFLTDRRRRLGEEGLKRLLEDALSLADLREHTNIRPHAIRHAAATRLLRNGADLRSIQQFLGHSQLQTTAMYLHTDERQLQRISELSRFGGERASPGDAPAPPNRHLDERPQVQPGPHCPGSVGRRTTPGVPQRPRSARETGFVPRRRAR